MIRIALLVLLLNINCFQAFSKTDTIDFEKRCLQIEERVNFIEKHLQIHEGEIQKINNNTIWYDPQEMRTVDIYKGRLDKLAGRLGYKWYAKDTDDWEMWHKVNKECIPENGCFDTNLGY